MTRWMFADAEGRILWSFTGGNADEAQAAANGCPLVTGPIIPATSVVGPFTHWRDGSEWALRPVPPAPPALVAGVAATWAGLPGDAVVTVTDPATGVVAGTGEADASGDLDLTLPAGPWRITVNEAFPAVGASFDIEVAPE